MTGPLLEGQLSAPLPMGEIAARSVFGPIAHGWNELREATNQLLARVPVEGRPHVLESLQDLTARLSGDQRLLLAVLLDEIVEAVQPRPAAPVIALASARPVLRTVPLA